MSEVMYAQTKGLALLNQIVAAVGPIFTSAHAHAQATSMGMASHQVRWLLSRMAQAGWVARIKQGVYVAQSPLLSTDIHPYAVAAALVEPMAISHWSALAHHGLTTQIPPMVQASTPHKVTTPEMRAGSAYRPREHAVWRALGLEFEFISVRPEHFFGFQQEWVSQWHRVALTDLERTLLDMVVHPQIFGSLRFGIETLEAHLERLDLEKLVEYALRYDVGAAIKRLGWILETLGVPGSVLSPLQGYPVQTYYRLDPAGPAGGIPVAYWKIRNNLAGQMHHADG